MAEAKPSTCFLEFVEGDERFDGVLLNIAQQSGSIDSILDAFFGFLQRKTDFFTGAQDEQAAEQMVLKCFVCSERRALFEVLQEALEGWTKEASGLERSTLNGLWQRSNKSATASRTKSASRRLKQRSRRTEKRRIE